MAMVSHDYVNAGDEGIVNPVLNLLNDERSASIRNYDGVLQPWLLTKEGYCSNCKAKNVTDDVVCCLFRKSSFHAI